MSLNKILAELIQSIALDAASSTPGLFTLATVVAHLEFSPYNGKGKGGMLTIAQQRAVNRWLETNCDRRVVNGRVWYGVR